MLENKGVASRACDMLLEIVKRVAPRACKLLEKFGIEGPKRLAPRACCKLLEKVESVGSRVCCQSPEKFKE